MTRTVVVNVATSLQPYPSDVIGLGVSIKITGMQAKMIKEAPYTATFDNVPAGSYTASAQAVSTLLQPLGPIIESAAFEVVDLPGPDAMVETPVSISVAFA